MRDREFLILHGWQGSDEDHWQTWLARRLRSEGVKVSYPQLPHKDDPSLSEWLDALAGELAAMTADERVVICHSLAGILWLHHCARGGRWVSRALLVAPPGPSTGIAELDDFFPVRLDAGAVREMAEATQLVCSDNDPYCGEGAKALYGDPLGIPTRVLAGGGHLNVEAGYGPWPVAADWCAGEGAWFTGG
ncbi:MAG TPA: alpha/beta hydrolase [Egibacteraceae bacterium]|nr:alpha/beta hydrolase [Egibacteraceae bacterium]